MNAENIENTTTARAYETNYVAFVRDSIATNQTFKSFSRAAIINEFFCRGCNFKSAKSVIGQIQKVYYACAAECNFATTRSYACYFAVCIETENAACRAESNRIARRFKFSISRKFANCKFFVGSHSNFIFRYVARRNFEFFIIVAVSKAKRRNAALNEIARRNEVETVLINGTAT